METHVRVVTGGSEPIRFRKRSAPGRWEQFLSVVGLAAGAVLGPVRSQAESPPAPATVHLSPSPPTFAMLPSPLALNEALEFARRNHPGLQISRAEIEIARTDSLAALIRPFNPELDLSLSRGGESLTSGDESSLGLGVSQEFDPWRKGGSRRALARARIRTSQSELALRQQQIETQVRVRFEAALFLQNRVRFLVPLVEQEQKVVASTRARVHEESVTPLTGRLTELDWVRIERELLLARAESRQAVMALAAAAGGVASGDLDLVGTFAPDSLGLSEDSLVALAAVNRRDTNVLEQRVAELQTELHVARLEGRPNLRLTAGISRERTAFRGSDLVGDPAIVGGIDGLREVDHRWEAKVSVPLPLWQRNQGLQARTTAEADRASATVVRSKLEIDLEVRAAARAFDDALNLFRLYASRADRVRDDLALVRAAYADGRISLDSYLTQKGRLVDTLLDQLEAEDRYWEMRGRLEAATAADFATLVRGGSK